MGTKVKYGKWKPVQLTGNLICNGVDGLVGIEELTDYEIAKGDGGRSVHKETGRKSLAAPAVGDFQLTSSKRKKYLRQSSSKRRKLNHKRDLQEKNVIDESKEELKTDEGESESTDSEDERKCEVSDFFNKMSAWSGLGIASSILKALAEQGFEKPTEIQAKTLPATILGRRDVLGAAETGSGKTLAFGIPVLHRILEDKERSRGDAKADDAEAYQNETESEESDNSELVDIGCAQDASDFSLQNTTGYPDSKLYALVLTPTRELAMQVHRHLTSAAKYTGIKFQVICNTSFTSFPGVHVICYRGSSTCCQALTCFSTLVHVFTLLSCDLWWLNGQCRNHHNASTKVAVVVGGMAPQKQERMLSRRPEIVVATPGRLWELIQDGSPHLAEVSNIRCC